MIKCSFGSDLKFGKKCVYFEIIKQQYVKKIWILKPGVRYETRIYTKYLNKLLLILNSDIMHFAIFNGIFILA